jgi:hypothetical protein
VVNNGDPAPVDMGAPTINQIHLQGWMPHHSELRSTWEGGGGGGNRGSKIIFLLGDEVDEYLPLSTVRRYPTWLTRQLAGVGRQPEAVGDDWLGHPKLQL